MRERRRRRARSFLGLAVLFTASLLAAALAAGGCASTDTSPPGAIFGDKPPKGTPEASEDGEAGEGGAEDSAPPVDAGSDRGVVDARSDG
jgi:hypothetical protein